MPIQILLNIAIYSSVYLLVSHSFSIIYFTSKYFNLLHASNLVLAPYLLIVFSFHQNTPLLISISLSILCVVVINILIYRAVLINLKKRGANNLVLLIATLGLYIIIEGLIFILFGAEKKILRTIDLSDSIQILDGYLTITNIWLILSSISLLIVTQIVLNKTSLGLKMKAVINNEHLSQIFGICSSKVQEIAFIIGTILASIAGILISYNIDLVPTMGFNLLLYGIIAMIIGGVGNTWGVIFGSIILAAAQNFGAYYFDSKWLDAIAFLILILFLVWKPLGLSGRKLKKVEI